MHLSPHTFEFLRDLEVNNDRIWFQANKYHYEAARHDMRNFVQELIVGLAGFDPKINMQIDVDSCLFRIYRDVRFRADKSPYKTWLGAGISVNGRKLEGPEYYIHIQPGKSFIAAGYWRPQKQHLNAIRQEIDYNLSDFSEIVRQLAESNDPLYLDREDQLKRAPSGYTEDHPGAPWLKLKSFTISKVFPDAQWTSTNSLDTVLKTYERMLPFKQFLEQAIDLADD